MVTVTLNGKGEMRRVKIDPAPGRSERGRDPRGSAGRGVQRRQGQGGDPRAGGDGQAHRRAELAGRAEAAVLSGPMAARALDDLIALLARLPGLGPALGPARGAAPDQAARDAAAPPRGGAGRCRATRSEVLGLRQSGRGRPVLDLRRCRARRPADLRGRGGRRSLGAGTLGHVSRAAITCSAAPCRRSTATAPRIWASIACWRGSRPSEVARGDSGDQRHGRRSDHRALHRRSPGRDRRRR